jgi:hypothetical protein
MVGGVDRYVVSLHYALLLADLIGDNGGCCWGAHTYCCCPLFRVRLLQLGQGEPQGSGVLDRCQSQFVYGTWP